MIQLSHFNIWHTGHEHPMNTNDEVTQLTYVQPRFLHRAGGLRSPECRHKEDVRTNSSVLVTGNLAIEHGH